jgi:hypothetical protein
MSFTLDQLTDSDGNYKFRLDPMINSIPVANTASQRRQAYKPEPAPPTRRQLTGWTMEQIGPQMWRVFRNSTTQGKQALMDFDSASSAQSFTDGLNREYKNPTKMSAASLRNKSKEHLTVQDLRDLAALKDGEGI